MIEQKLYWLLFHVKRTCIWFGLNIVINCFIDMSRMIWQNIFSLIPNYVSIVFNNIIWLSYFFFLLNVDQKTILNTLKNCCSIISILKWESNNKQLCQRAINWAKSRDFNIFKNKRIEVNHKVKIRAQFNVLPYHLNH